MSSIRAVAAAIVVLLGAIAAAQAQSDQVSVNFPQFSTVTHGPDQINAGSLAIHWSFPIFRKKGRAGLDYDVMLSYDSAAVYSNRTIFVLEGQPPPVLTTVPTARPSAGFSLTDGHPVGVLHNHEFDGLFACQVQTGGGTADLFFQNFDSWIYVDTGGLSHFFPGILSINPCNNQFVSFPSSQALDGSGYVLTITPVAGSVFFKMTITAPSGNKYLMAGLNGNITDTNGNQLPTMLNQGVLLAPGVGLLAQGTDTLGMQPVTMTSGTSADDSSTFSEIFTYTDTNGKAEAVTVNFKSYAVFTLLGCNDAVDETDQLVSSIVYLDGSKYAFTYEASTDLSAPAGSITGRLKTVTLPTGGNITYTYPAGQPYLASSCSRTGGTATTPSNLVTQSLTRTTSDGQSVTYTRTGTTPSPFQIAAAASQSVSLTDADSGPTLTAQAKTVVEDAIGKTTINFASWIRTRDALAGEHIVDFFATPNFIETSRSVIDKTNNNLDAKDVFTCYNFQAVPCDGTPVIPPILQRTQLTKLNNGQQTQVVTNYNSMGLVTEEDVYDFGQSAPGPLLKTTTTSYATLGNNILNRPQTVTVFDGAGNQSAQTTYAYDEPQPNSTVTVTPTSGVPNHVAVTGARGNATTVSRWLNTTGGTVTTHQTFDDTGNVLSSTDANGNVTTYSYSDNFSDGVDRSSLAYRTKTTLPQTVNNQ